ncbi:hypothetical protein FCU94_18895 [Vibrio sp. JPW-9-11-11]|uniref:amidoligase family protein n=1 Tax=Vibrio sp. JPW-9-11-11 TaxID=1416532 RepID=UPI0015938D7D|nr:amidoligase family protein [Vibrio sp. JPW-9-11-11]NVD08921.1 hypothetical protein [Vibrio sp. JPW-9-11-11]
MKFNLPAQHKTAKGADRRVGFELEFTGLTLEETAKQVQATFGGQLEQSTAAEYRVHSDALGTFTIELDWDYLKRKASEAKQQDDGHEWVELLQQGALVIVPLEIICPPVSIKQLSHLDELIPILRRVGAKGTESSMFAAFGVHINPELPSLDVATIERYVKAFALLQWWLVEAHQVDVTRKLSPYVNLYPEAYVYELLSQSYSDLDAFTDHYLEHNPTRNRALDLLPLLTEINRERVLKTVDDQLINPRPTFHYRLPDCQIEDENWSLANSWNLWCVVERLANDRPAIEELSNKFIEMTRPVIGVSREAWQKEVSQWLVDREWV